jgi:cobalt-zinc-cadmium efflux system membrane fusion protein
MTMKRNRTTNYTKYLVAALLIGTIASCGGGKTADITQKTEEDSTKHQDEWVVELTPEQLLNAGIETHPVEYRSLSGTIKVNGTLDVPPQQLVSISAPMGGFIKNIDMLQGQHVTKGQVVATLQDPAYIQLQQDYLEASSQLEYLQADYERQQELAKENVNAGKTLQQAKASYGTTLAKVKGLREKLKLININMVQLEKGEIQSTINLYAPISGYVTDVHVNMGKYVSSTDVMFEIVDTEHLHAELTVFEKEVPQLKIGQKVHFTLANENKDRTATVYLVGREISADRTVRVHCHLDREDKNLLPGMYLTALVETHNRSLPAVPEQAVVSFEGTDYIFITSGDKKAGTQYRAVPIKTGVKELGYIELVLPEGFDTAGVKIVIKGAYDLLGKLKNSEEEEDH